MKTFGKEDLDVARGRAGLSFASGSPRHFLRGGRSGDDGFFPLDANGLEGRCGDSDDVAAAAAAGANVDDLVLRVEDGLCGREGSGLECGLLCGCVDWLCD